MPEKTVNLVTNKRHLGETIYAVASDFGTGTPIVVTLILEDDKTNNTFWNKHALRKDEDPKSILDARRSLKDMSADGLQYASGIGVPFTKQGKPHNLQFSTSIDFSRVDPKLVVYRIAKALVLEVNSAGIAPGQRIDVNVDFKTDKATTTVGVAAPQSWNRGARLGGDFKARQGNQWTFSIDHLDGVYM